MSIYYSTNWCGPTSTSWYRDRGLLRKVEHTFTFGPYAGETWQIEEIITPYCAGRIDIRDSEKPGYEGWDEYGLAPMHAQDWGALSEWLDGLRTKEQLSYDDLIEKFQKWYGKSIRWAD